MDQNVADQPPANPAVADAVLPMPNNGDLASPKLPTKSSSQASLDRALPLRKSPTVTPESVKENFKMIPLPYKKFPEGVVEVKNENDNLEEIGDSFPNRYRNELIENERANEEEAKKSEQAAARIEEAEKDNGAHEELDFPIQGNDEKVKLNNHHNINDLGIVANLRNDAQERVADVDQNEQLEEEDGNFRKM